MAKGRHTKKKTRKRRQSSSSAEKGFDFGEQMPVMAIGDVEFSQVLRETGVFACAYGYQQIAGFPHPIPALTLVGENRSAFKKAFEHFARWGCEEDGDTVDIHMMLKVDGTYEMWIGPEVERVMYRTLLQAELYRPMVFNCSWVKSFDSTHPAVRDLMRYCKSDISPVVVTAAVGSRTTPDLSKIEHLDSLPKLIKFDLRIIEEGTDSDDPRFHVQKKRQKLDPADEGSSLTPAEYCRLRTQTFDVAFPVSRERVRRSDLLTRLRELPGFADVSETQVVQAAINVMLSDELAPGDRHYSQMANEFPKKLWDFVSSRYEVANGGVKPADQEPAIVAHQLELDVGHVLRRQNVSTTNQQFVKLQALFRQNGFIDD